MFTASEVELFYYQKKFNVPVASRVFKRIEAYDVRKLGSFNKIHGVFWFNGE